MYLLYVYNFENLCVARCRHDYGLWAALAKELKGQMLIVTVLPDVLAQSTTDEGPRLGRNVW